MHESLSPSEYLRKTAQESISAKEAFLVESSEALIRAAQMLAECVNRGGKVLILGNGGSAADAQHMAAEMIGRMLLERGPLAAIALTTDSSNLTALGNDYGYDQVFVRQLLALAKPEDLVIAISTSGQSANVLSAVKAARKIGCPIIGLTGGSGGLLAESCDLSLCVRLATNSSRIQESHIFAIHSMVDLMDRYFLKSSPEIRQ